VVEILLRSKSKIKIMNKFIINLSKKPAFCQKGLIGYTFPIKNKKIGLHFIDVKKGHDTFIISKKCNHIYYILSGNGSFEIKGRIFKVKKEMMVNVPTKIEYTYSGKMKLFLIMLPPWFRGNEIVIKNNPAV